MALPKERRNKLKKILKHVLDDDVLNEVDALAIIQICLDACEREKSGMMEDMLREQIVSGGDEK